ncbi:MAG: energy-coupling factor transporter transmembrane protein EcfT [Candidatus Lokiarchaeota archaeon]|nr:energy-coupling factor transporter transmembrane protein EcfT [Candidatus Lokiarchaeota archaeon]
MRFTHQYTLFFERSKRELRRYKKLDIELPFKHETEKNFLSKIHPLIRVFLPFILVIPFILLYDVYLVIAITLLSFFLNLAFNLHPFKILSKIKALIPFILLITIFIPFYVGNTVLFQLNIGITLNIYQEGLTLALTLFFRIFGAAFIFMTFLTSLTYSEFIEALTKLRVVPPFFIGSIVIMLHYIPILAMSNKKVLDAQDLRGKNFTSYWQRIKAHAFIMGKNVVHNMERSEKLYESLKLRGFSGRITFSSKKLKLVDILMVLLFLSIIFALIYFIHIKQIQIEVFQLFIL